MNQTITRSQRRTPSKRRQSKSADKRKSACILSPNRLGIGRAGIFFGTLGRASVAFVGTLGILLFAFDAFQIEVPLGVHMTASAVWTLFFTLMSSGLLPAVITLGTSALALGILTFAIQRSPQFYIYFIANSAASFFNGIMERLGLIGYRTASLLPYTELEGLGIEDYRIGAAFIIAMVFSLLFTLCTVRFTLLLPAIAVGGAVCAAIFTYNISSSNWGFALILTALAGMLALKMHDSAFNRTKMYPEADSFGGSVREATRADSASGGCASFFTMLVVFAVIFLPAKSIDENWELIDPINDRMAYLRAVVSSVIIGDVPNLNDLGYLGNMDTLNARTTVADERTFTGEEMLEVQTAYNTPVYLRSWIGSYYYEDSWYSASGDMVDQYRNELFDEDFSPEDITYEILSTVDPTLVTLNNMGSYVGHMDLGYITMAVDVKNLSSSGNLLFIPSMMNPETGLLEPGTADKTDVYDGEWQNYHEGIVTSSWFNFDKEYRTVSFVPSYRNTEFDDELYAMTQYYNLMMRYIYLNHSLTDPDDIAHVVNFANAAADELGYDYFKPSIIERYYEMNSVDRMNFLQRHYEIYETYRSYVEAYYLSHPESEALDAAVSDIFSFKQTVTSPNGATATFESGLYDIYFDPNTGEIMKTVHDKVMLVIDYLTENFEYTLNPKEPSRKRVSALDTFLADTRQGYCVQFATSAAMILRSVGVPTRYVEGYVASEFIRNTDPERLGNYITTVCDYDAHAWIEVWVDGFGWMQYEVTPSYYASMYEPLSSTSAVVSGSNTPFIPEEEEDYEEPEITIEVEEETDFSLFVPLIACLIAAAILVPIVVLSLRFRASANKRRRDREEIVSTALKGTDESDSRKYARLLGNYIMALLKMRGLVPQTGELPSEFAARVDAALAESEEKRRNKRKRSLDFDALSYDDESFAEVMDCIQTARFSPTGTVIGNESLRRCAEFYRFWQKRTYGDMGPLRRFLNRTILRVI